MGENMARKKSGAVKSTATKIQNLLIQIFLIFVMMLTIYPILYVILGSFKGNQELLLGGINLIPRKFIISNYTEAWTLGNFGVYTVNSIVLSISIMVLTLVITSMAGYCLARKKFWGSSVIYGLLLIFMFINVGSVSLRPLFELSVKVGMNKSLLSVILISTGTAQAANIFLIRGFMNSIPKELDEAAKIDGCTFFQIYCRIILPVLKPILATVGLLSFRSGWNEYILPLVFTMSNEKLRPLTVGVVQLRNAGDGAAAWNIMFAGSTIAIVPIIVIYMFFSKHFMEGMTSGAVKG
ncbi:multiple sugar transport system permease protein [Anaerocolumna jejuensis DSM 15929]|uniref:Multiple sugar transport system permease protein n=2 Tax=Anaerocolumna TaxID=1843210 RepID=A0A1M6TBE3_9FIRM|nr:multiple sugar transport system permease protein [Anaerocolumna jejuensis DSM 15929]